MSMFLSVEQISTQAKQGFSLKEISFQLQQNSTLAVAGATGSGKSSLLKIVAGMESPLSGAVYFEGERVKKVPEEKLIPGHPGIAYLSQHFELRNHYRMEELMDYANQLPTEEADRIFHICKVDHLLKRKAHEVSGGEKQRLALARLLVSSPRLLILDEPFSNLDLPHKNILKKVIEEVSAELNITLILVTHEPSDMLSMADEIIVLENGTMVQQGKPGELYSSPVNEYTGALLGKYNMIPTEQLPVDLALNLPAEETGRLFVRPEDIKISLRNSSNRIKGTVIKTLFAGFFYELHIDILGSILLVFANQYYKPGTKIYCTVAPRIVHLL